MKTERHPLTEILMVVGREPLRNNEYPICFVKGSKLLITAEREEMVARIEPRLENFGSYTLLFFDAINPDGVVVASINAIEAGYITHEAPKPLEDQLLSIRAVERAILTASEAQPSNEGAAPEGGDKFNEH